MIDLKH